MVTKADLGVPSSEPSTSRESRDAIRFHELFDERWQGLTQAVIQSGAFPADEGRFAMSSLMQDKRLRRDLDDKEMKPIYEETFGSSKNQDAASAVRSLHNIMAESGGQSLIPYVDQLRMLLSARNVVLNKVSRETEFLESLASGEVRFRIEGQTPEEALKSRTMRYGSSMISYFHFAQDFAQRVEAAESMYFGEKAELAGNLWRATVYLRKVPSLGSKNPSELRAEIIPLLIDEEYDAARVKIEELMMRYPGILPDFVTDNLNIDPELLKELTTEDQEQREAKKREFEKAWGDRTFALKNEILDKLDPVLDRELVSPDGRVVRFKWNGKEGVKKRLLVQAPIDMKNTAGYPAKGGTISPENALAFIDLFDLKPKDNSD